MEFVHGTLALALTGFCCPPTMQSGVNHNVPVVVTMRGKKVHHTLRQNQRHLNQGQGKRQGFPHTTLEVIHKRLEEFNQNQECLTMTNLHKMYPAEKLGACTSS